MRKLRNSVESDDVGTDFSPTPFFPTPKLFDVPNMGSVPPSLLISLLLLSPHNLLSYFRNIHLLQRHGCNLVPPSPDTNFISLLSQLPPFPYQHHFPTHCFNNYVISNSQKSIHINHLVLQYCVGPIILVTLLSERLYEFQHSICNPGESQTTDSSVANICCHP